MSNSQHPLFQLLNEDRRFKLDAYQFIRDSLAYAQEELGMGGGSDLEEEEPHLTGQQLCEAVRQYAIEQFGLMAKVVLNSWGVHSTGDFGEIVYNLIDAGLMKKSKRDRREDFDEVYSFDEAFQQQFQITKPE